MSNLSTTVSQIDTSLSAIWNAIKTAASDGLVLNEPSNHSNSGTYCLISGFSNQNNSGSCNVISGAGNYSNTGSNCIISGYFNSSNSGNNCFISGDANSSNAGDNCSISGYYNTSNSGNYSLISGRSNSGNSGSFCSIIGNGHNSNSGSYCLISGNQNHSNSGSSCIISGALNYSNSGAYSCIYGLVNDNNKGNYSLIGGSSARNNSFSYARVHGGGNNARIIDLVAQINSSGASATELLLGGSGGSKIVIPDESAWNVDVRLVAKTATGANASMQNFSGLLVRSGGATMNWSDGVVDTPVTIGTTNATFDVDKDDGTSESSATGTASDDYINKVSTAAVNGDTVRFTTLTGGSGLNTSTDYFVVQKTTDKFKVSTIPGGAPVDISSDYSSVAYTLNPRLKVTVTCSSGTVRAAARIQLTQVDY